MPKKDERFFFDAFLIAPVIVLILGALTLCALSIPENLRVARTIDQIQQLVALTHKLVVEQKTLTPNPGDDVWTDIERTGQAISDSARATPWQTGISAKFVTNSALRVEADVPTRDCRHIALYLLSNGPPNFGLLAIQALPVGGKAWVQVYPTPATIHAGIGDMVQAACGVLDIARLGLVFQIR